MDISLLLRAPVGAPGSSVRRSCVWWLPGITGLLLLSACSDPDYSYRSAFDERLPSGSQTGVFKAGNVVGLDYVVGSSRGVTDANGQFMCTTGQSIAFAIGNVQLGSAACATVVHPAAFVSSGSLTDPAALNVTRLLMMLDEDEMPENGIVISAPLQVLADSWPAVDFTAEDLEAQLASVMSDIASVEGRETVSLPSNAEAFTYLDASLSCAYSGAFVNTFPAGGFFAPTDVALIAYRDPGSLRNRYSIQIMRVHPASEMYLQAVGSVELQTLPKLVNDVAGQTGSIAAGYLTPDLISGRWMNAVSQQSFDRNGVFKAVRIGSTFGDYRFVGSFTRIADEGWTVVLGVAVFTFNGDVITGEAYDLSLGIAVPLSGRRLPGTELIEFSTQITEDTVTATVLTDTNGQPIGLAGQWPGIEDATFDAVGCRLN